MRAYTTINFNMYDTSSKDVATVIAQGSQTDADHLLSDVIDSANYASTEHNEFLLDGSYTFLESGMPTGFYSDTVSKRDGTMEQSNVIVFTFSQSISTIGVTLYFPKDEYPEQIRIKWYEGNMVIDSKLFYPDNMVFVCRNSVENYDKLEIEFLSLQNAGHYIKLAGIQFGCVLEFGIDKLIKASLTQEVDLLSDEIPISSLEFDLEDKEGRFNVTRDGNLFFAAQEGQEIIVTVNLSVNGEQKDIFIGKYYLEEISNKTITASFKAQDIIGLLDGETVPDKYYNTTLSAFCEDILSGYEYVIEDEELNDITIKGYLSSCSKREALQQACFVAGAIATSKGSDKLRIYMPFERDVSLLADDQIYAGGYVKSVQLYKTMDITVHNFDRSGEDTPSERSIVLNRRGGGTISISEACFVNADNVDDVIERLKAHYSQKVTYELSMPLERYYELGSEMMAYLNK